MERSHEFEITTQTRWQPLMVVSPKRLDCTRCGAKAIFLLFDSPPSPDDPDGEVCWDLFCQECWTALQE